MFSLSICRTMKFTEDTLAKLNTLPILEVAQKLGLSYRRTGANWQVCRCFLHDDHHPSMGLSALRNHWTCFSCHQGGGVIDLVMKHENLSFLEASDWLVRQFSIYVPAEEKTHSFFKAIQPKLMNTVNTYYLQQSLLEEFSSTDNSLTRALVQCHILTPQQMQKACQQFHLGTEQNRVIFWMQDEAGRLHEGKIMEYQANAHRSHTVNPITLSYLLKKANRLEPEWKAQPCLFGQHQLADAPHDAIIAVVESEKTAVICSQLLPESQSHPVLWMATGGFSQLNPKLLQPLQGHKIILFPDTDSTGKTFRAWQEIATHAQPYLGHPVTVSPILENNATPQQKEQKIDLADFLDPSDLSKR